MALTRTAAEMEADARQRADMVGSDFRTQAQIFRYLTESCRALVSTLIERYGEDYWASSTTVSASASTATTALPSDFWKLLTLRVTIDGTRRVIRKADVDELDVEASADAGWTNEWPRYRIRGQNFVWTPIPTASHTVTVDFVSTKIFKNTGGTAIDKMTATTDYFDGVFGWEEWVTLKTAIRLLRDTRKDTRDLQAELDELTETIVGAARSRDATSPSRVRDTWRADERDLDLRYWER